MTKQQKGRIKINLVLTRPSLFMRDFLFSCRLQRRAVANLAGESTARLWDL